jgi:hypothetical protein
MMQYDENTGEVISMLSSPFSAERDKIIPALIAAQAEFPTIGKDASGYNYKYATLASVVEAVRPTLKEHGLAFAQLVVGSSDLVTILMHESGQTLTCHTEIVPTTLSGKSSAAQQFGAAITYARRYALTAMLGLASDEDTDGAPQGNQQRRRPHKRQQQPPPPQEGQESKSKPAHWITHDNVRKKFWAYAKKIGLSRDQVHEALDVESVKDFDGSKAVAHSLLDQYAAVMSQPPTAGPDVGDGENQPDEASADAPAAW